MVQPVTESRTSVYTRVLESKVQIRSGGQQACLGHPVPAGSDGYASVPPTTAHEYRALWGLARCLGADMTGCLRSLREAKSEARSNARCLQTLET